MTTTDANPTPEVGQVWADRDERTAHIACDADLRRRNEIWRDIASRLVVKAVSA